MNLKKPYLVLNQIATGRSFRIMVFLLCLCFLGKDVYAQPPFYNNDNGTSYNSFPLNTTGSNKVQWIYGPNVFKTKGSTGTPAPGGLIEKVYFRLGTTFSGSSTYSNFTISFAQNQGTNTTWSTTTFVTGLTQAFYASSYSLTGAKATSWYEITLNTPFKYDPNLSLVFEMKVSAGTGNQVAQTTSGGTQRIWGGYSSNSGSNGTGLVDFGISVKSSDFDLTNLGITSLNNSCGANPDPVILQIKNTGLKDIPASENIPVYANVTGGVIQNFSRFYNRALKVGITDTIHMGTLNTDTIKGGVTITSWTTYKLDSVPINDTDITKRTFLGPTKPTPDFKFALTCDSVIFTNATTDGCKDATGFLWDFDNAKTSTKYSPSHFYNSAGTYFVKLIVFYGAGLRDSVIKKVEVYPKPAANFTFSSKCLGQATDFNNISYGGSSYKWDFGDGKSSTLTNPNHTYSFAGTYKVILEATSPNSCSDTISKSVVVYPKPAASFGANNVCAGSSIGINNTSINGVTFNWDFGDGNSSLLENPVKIYNTAGTYSIKLTVFSSQGCSDFAGRTLTIYALPKASFTATEVCLGKATSFSNNSIGANKTNWTFGDGRTSSTYSPSLNYLVAKTYDVTLTVTSVNGCVDNYTQPVTVHEIPIAYFQSKNGCKGESIDFINQSSMPGTNGTYLWRYGDGNISSQTSPSYSYGAANNYQVSLVAKTEFGCVDSALSIVRIYDLPTAGFTAKDACDKQSVNFINTSSGGVVQNWEFGDGQTANTFSPSHIYSGVGTYKVKLTITNSDNCKDSYEGNVNVLQAPEVLFNAEDHCHQSEAPLSNLSNGASTYVWNFGNGDSTTSSNPKYKFPNSGTYSVKLKGFSTKGCVAEYIRSVKVFAKPIPAFTSPTVCTGQSSQFTNTSTGANSYFWNFGDGSGSSTVKDPQYTYLNSGNYKVILTATSADNCISEISQNVSIAQLPIPIFIVKDVCEGEDMIPVNSSQGLITSQNWNFGDGNTDPGFSPTHQYAAPGVYNITLTVSTALGCTDSTSKTILIYNKPLVKISSDVQLSKGFSTPLLAGGGTDYTWTPAGTLDNASIASPVATPDMDTRYIVTVTNSFGCKDTASVLVSLISDFNIVPQNLITPNANGQNDLWKIQGIEFYPDATVMIFDQWGRILLNETGYQNTWDGTVDGKPLPDGTYFYVITTTDSEREYKGIITILNNK
ncbi:MAG: PKD domain-containing protein [Flavobacteriales bacterium]|nr:PKD domain-containing protein [Flavobacteriales bacterium]